MFNGAIADPCYQCQCDLLYYVDISDNVPVTMDRVFYIRAVLRIVQGWFGSISAQTSKVSVATIEGVKALKSPNVE